jgi:hypothetical protein
LRDFPTVLELGTEHDLRQLAVAVEAILGFLGSANRLGHHGERRGRRQAAFCVGRALTHGEGELAGGPGGYSAYVISIDSSLGVQDSAPGADVSYTNIDREAHRTERLLLIPDRETDAGGNVEAAERPP